MTRQNPQNKCEPSVDSDQPGHLPCLIRVFTLRTVGNFIMDPNFFMQIAKTDETEPSPWVNSHPVGFLLSEFI